MTRTGFVHRALCYGSDDEFLDGTLTFALDGLAAGETVLAVVATRNIDLLGRALGRRRDEVEFVDADDWYGSPSRTLGRYNAYCADHDTDGAGRPSRIRIIGEPVWPGRTEFETREWMRYESLLNVAFAGTGHRILCPYDTRALPPGVVRSATRTHPELALAAGDSAASGHYADPADFYAECDAARPYGLPAGRDDIPFGRGRSALVRRALRSYALDLGVSEHRLDDMVAAVHEVVVNSVRHGGGRGVLRLRNDFEYVICEVSDVGTGASTVPPLFPGHLPPDRRAVNGHGMWVVRQLSDLLTETLDPAGSVVRLYFKRGARGPTRAACPPPAV
ncbi:anti-sigma factor RsbA family regulatory protein [Streptomyces aurantiacus]|uniref:Anti-sigma regulatory factor n=1 Tax=Streptomyces aurantiacus TaxID=47760 RepID=A0A7G1PG05_9ACTN|nr:sensor histidine kinase [Streptomyces aurantiacus]BCL32716.1 anti-sigma regulatory factor [Streptomyces aurantiacus]